MVRLGVRYVHIVDEAKYIEDVRRGCRRRRGQDGGGSSQPPP